MEIPVYENDVPAGTLYVRAQGLYTVFEARLPALASPFGGGGCGVSRPPQTEGVSSHRGGVAPGLTRLWLLDETGAAAPLGLLEPTGEGRRLIRRLTRLELRALPNRPAFALALPDGENPTEQSLPRARGRCPSAHTGADEVYAFPSQGEGGIRRSPASRMTDEVIIEDPRCARGPHQSPPATASPCAGKPNTPPSSPAAPHSDFRTPHSEFSWRTLPDGSLIDPSRRLLALPWAGGEAPAPARIISVDGREYLAFRY